MSLRRVRSPEAPKMTSTHDSPLANGVIAGRTRGVASTIVLIDFLRVSSQLTLGGCFLQMSAEPVAHGRKQFVLIVSLAAGREALVQCCRQDGNWHGFINCGLDGPAAFTGVRHPPGKLRQ